MVMVYPVESRVEYNVQDPFWKGGARGDGVTDDTAAIQMALNWCYAYRGGIIYLPPGIYRTSATLVIPGSNILMKGAGAEAGNTNAPWLGATVIQPVAGFVGDVISTPLPPTPGTAGFIQYGVGIRDLAVDCSTMSLTAAFYTAGLGNGIHFYGVRYGYLNNVGVFGNPNWSFLFEGDATNYAYNSTIFNCVASPNATYGGGFLFTNSEQCSMLRCITEGAGAATLVNQPYNGVTPTPSTVAYLLYSTAGWTNIQACTLGNLGTYTNEAILLTNGETSWVMGCLFDGTHGIAFHCTGANQVVMGNTFDNCCASVAGPVVKLGSGGNVVSGNTVRAGGSPNWTYAIQEANTYTPGSMITNNLLTAGTSGAVSLNAATHSKAANNSGYNPVGTLATPAIPASGTAYTNQSGVDAMVYVVGGTVTIIAVEGQTTGLTSGAIFVPASATITLTYSVAPTWVWSGN